MKHSKLFWVPLLALLALFPLGTQAQESEGDDAYTAINLTRTSLNNLEMSYDETTGEYTFTSTGGDPYVFSENLAADLPNDATILSFEYNCTSGLNLLQVFFPDPLDEAHSITNYDVGATGENEWVTYQLNIGNYRATNGWGKKGNRLRFDFGSLAGVTIKVRNIRISKLQEGKTLSEYLENMPYGIEGYVYGTTPGCVGDEDAYNEFYDAFQNALSVNDDPSSTEEAQNQALETLKAARAKVEATIVPITDGNYFIETAYSAFADKDTMAWFAPRTTGYPGWKKKSNTVLSIWNIKKLDDGNYSIQSLATGQYINHTAVVDANDSPLTLSDNLETEQEISNLGPNGQFSIRSAGAQRIYNIQGSGGGANTLGPIASWTDGSISGEGAWRLVPVSAEELAAADASKNVVLAFTKYDGITNGAVVGPEIGKPHSQTEIDEVDEALRVARLLANGDSVANAEGMDAAAAKLTEMADKFLNSVNVVPNGYYRIRANYVNFAKNDNDAYFALYNDSTPGWKHYQKTSEQIWKITAVDGGYTVQNVKNGMYINKAPDKNNGSLVDMTKEPETTQLITTIHPNGKWSIYNTADSEFGYDPAGHNYGASETGRLQIWSPRDENGGTSWSLIAVSEDEAKALVANEADNELNLKLQAEYEKARAAYNAKAQYTLGNPIISDIKQVYANNWSPNEGAHLEYIIDGNKDTYWNSTWEAGLEQDPANPHYLRIYDEAGFPDSVQVNYVMRQNGTWHRIPVKLRVEVANDTTDWKNLYELKLADFDGNGTINLSIQHTDSLHYLVTGLKGYKYARFITEVNRHSDGGIYMANNHMMMEYAEYNLYPVTGEDAASFTQQPTHKAFADNLAAALKEAEPQYLNGTATQATLDKLTAALDAFNNIYVSDNALQFALYNVENLTVGDRIGEFAEADLSAYKTAVQEAAGTILDKINNGETLSTTEINAVVPKLDEAYATLLKTMNKPEKNAWYMILAGDGESIIDGDGAPVAISAGGPCTHRTEEDSYSYFLYNYQNEDQGSTSTGVSFTVNEDANGKFVIQCVRNGGYFGPLTGSGNTKYDYHPIIWYTPKSFDIIPLGEGQIAFKGTDGYYIKGGSLVMDYTDNLGDYTNLQNSGYAWTLKRTEDNHADLTWNIYSNVAAHRVIALSVPYEIQNPAKWGQEDLYAYEIVGKTTTGDDNNTITAYWLKQVEDETIGAGKPAIYVTPGDVYDESVVANISFTPVLNTALQAEVDTVNGLRSTNCNWPTTEDHLGYFLADSVVDEPAGILIGRQRGVIIPRLVKNTVDNADEADIIIYVQGAGMLNGIANKIVAIKKFVNVYTTDGVLLRKHVDSTTATQGLKKGIYIVGNKKVLVK